jgi:Fe-S-cluster-containing hydrogenase component 2
MFVVTIEAEDCVGCGECAASCPSQIISMVEGKAEVTGDSAECLGCQSCVIVCASGGVEVQEF